MHSCWGQLGVLPTLRRAGPGLLLPMAFPIEKGKSIPGSVSTVMGGGELLFSNRLENKLLKKSFEGKKKKRKSKKTQPNPQLLRLMFPPVRARSTPMPISRYPQSCPLEIAHLGAPTTHTQRRDFLARGWLALSSTENPTLLSFCSVPWCHSEAGPPGGLAGVCATSFGGHLSPCTCLVPATFPPMVCQTPDFSIAMKEEINYKDRSCRHLPDEMV